MHQRIHHTMVMKKASSVPPPVKSQSGVASVSLCDWCHSTPIILEVFATGCKTSLSLCKYVYPKGESFASVIARPFSSHANARHPSCICYRQRCMTQTKVSGCCADNTPPLPQHRHHATLFSHRTPPLHGIATTTPLPPRQSLWHWHPHGIVPQNATCMHVNK